MEIVLTPSELYQVNSIQSKNTIRVLPKGKHKQSKVVVGDSNGTLTCFGVKKGSTRKEWIYQRRGDDDDSNLSSGVGSMALGGSKKDKIFITRRTDIEGVSRKGKSFFEMKTNVTDALSEIMVKDTKLFTAGHHTYNVFENEKDIAHLLVSAPINTMCLAELTSRKSGLRTFLGCNDRTVRVLYEDKSVNQIPFKENVSMLRTYIDNELNPSDENNAHLNMLYGTDRGSLGMLHIPRVNAANSPSQDNNNNNMGGGKKNEEDDENEKSLMDDGGRKTKDKKSEEGKKNDNTDDNDANITQDSKNNEVGVEYEDRAVTVRRGWLLSGKQKKSNQRLAAINSITSCDLTADGVSDILVGRNDGTIQVYGFDQDAEYPRNQFTTSLGESIRGIDHGEVSAAGYEEIIVSTFSGRVIGLTTESLAEKESSDKYGRSKGQIRREVQVKDMKSDIESLKKQLNDEAKNLAKAFGKAEKKSKKDKKSSDDGMSVDRYLFTSSFDVNHEYVLVPEKAAYMLTIEVPIPLEYLILSASVHVDVLSDHESNNIICETPITNQSQKLLATIRVPQDDGVQHRTKIKVRAVEGQHGELSVYIVGRTGTGKSDLSCVHLKLPIKPLSLHARIHKLPENRPYSTLTVTGSFSIGQAHQWILEALPEVPDIIQGDSEVIIFQSTFVKSVLKVEYSAGKLLLTSDNVSTLAIMKETITKTANSRSMQISVKSYINDNVAEHVLTLIDKKLSHHSGLSEKFNLINALQEIVGQGDTGFLDKKYQNILKNRQKLTEEVKTSPQELQALYGVITDLFVDKHMFNGRRLQHLLPELTALLQRYDRKKVLEFINSGGSN